VAALASAQIQACAAWARHECFCSRARLGRAIAKATNDHARSRARRPPPAIAFAQKEEPGEPLARSLRDERDHRAADRGVIATDGRRSRDAGRADNRIDQPRARFPRDRLATHPSASLDDAGARFRHLGGLQRTLGTSGKHASVTGGRGRRQPPGVAHVCFLRMRSSACRCRLDPGGSRLRPNSAVHLRRTATPARRSHSRRATAPTTASRRCLCHGLSRLAATGGRLLQPGDAEAEPLEAGGIHRAIAFSAASAPDLRAGAIVSP
jgi:hypothetical protein